MGEPITFLATFPQIQSAIKVDGAGGARVQLDIPETELPAIARLLLMRGIVLKVTIEEFKEIQAGDEETRPQVHTRTARRPTDVAGG